MTFKWGLWRPRHIYLWLVLSGVKPTGAPQVLAFWSWQACSLLARHDSTPCFGGNLCGWIIKGQYAAESMNSNKYQEGLGSFQRLRPDCPALVQARDSYYHWKWAFVLPRSSLTPRHPGLAWNNFLSQHNTLQGEYFKPNNPNKETE